MIDIKRNSGDIIGAFTVDIVGLRGALTRVCAEQSVTFSAGIAAPIWAAFFAATVGGARSGRDGEIKGA